MTDQESNNPTNSRPISLIPLSADEALRAVLQVKKGDVEKMERQEAKAKKKGPKPKK